MKKIIHFIFVLLLISIIWSCNSEKNNFIKAKQTNTIEALKSFAENYPNGDYLDSAKLLIDKIIWQEVQAGNAVEDYESFIEDYPFSSFVDSANVMIKKLEQTDETETEDSE